MDQKIDRIIRMILNVTGNDKGSGDLDLDYSGIDSTVRHRGGYEVDGMGLDNEMMTRKEDTTMMEAKQVEDGVEDEIL